MTMKRDPLVNIVDWCVENFMGLVGTGDATSICIHKLDIWLAIPTKSVGMKVGC